VSTWIARRDADDVAAEVARADPAAPLAGLRLGVKDNIDVAGVPTTAGCPAYAFVPERSAPVVDRLVAAGAVYAGKTNLDQFATGLVGTRSPHGAPESPLAPGYVSGGSSSGSAVAVAMGEADIALGTDTAGSGRVPAAFCGVVGLKPTPGWLSLRGVVPACASFDCVTVFARDVDTAARAVVTAAGVDPDDPSSRAEPSPNPTSGAARIGVPSLAVLARWCDEPVVEAFAELVTRARMAGFDVVDSDITVYLDAGELLYGGAFVAERYDAVGAFVDAHPDEVDPTVRSIISAAGRLPAHALARDLQRLRTLRRRASVVWDGCDALLLPTTPSHPMVDSVAADPIGINAGLGRFTNGCNLLGWCAAAVPGGDRSDGLPFGFTVLGRAWHDRQVWDVASRLTRPSTGVGVAASARAGDTACRR
jgi:allophanate hydrolase